MQERKTEDLTSELNESYAGDTHAPAVEGSDSASAASPAATVDESMLDPRDVDQYGTDPTLAEGALGDSPAPEPAGPSIS